MPTYEYLCKACEHEFEREQRISEPPVKTCPKCRSRQVKRLLSAPRFHLKGGGWYSDLYASAKPGAKGAKKGEGAKEESASKPADTGSSKGESGGAKSSASKAAA